MTAGRFEVIFLGLRSSCGHKGNLKMDNDAKTYIKYLKIVL